MKRILFLAAAFGLSACAGTPTPASLQAGAATARADLSQAITLYGVAKGIALVAELSDPALAPIIDPAIARLDPIVATAKLALADATIDAAAVGALSNTITAQANAMAVTAAPAVVVLPR